MRRGVSRGAPAIVVHLLPRAAEGSGAEVPTRLGFIVGRPVGNAVTRNRVKRRLREAGAIWLKDHGQGFDVVVRAKRNSATASWSELEEELLHCLTRLEGKARR